MAYDSARGVVVLFGGHDGENQWKTPCCFNDTWEYDGQRWLKGATAPAALTPRGGHAMTFHARVGRVVLFGGHDDAQRRGDTWLYDGITWEPLPFDRYPPPPPRSGHAMTYDVYRARGILFGGEGEQGQLNDTWEFDGVAWLRGPAAPEDLTPRLGATMAYSQGDRMTFLFGVGKFLAEETWTYDGVVWREGPKPPPELSGRQRPVMVEDAGRRRILLFAGSPYYAIDPTDVWELDGSGWRPGIVPMKDVGGRNTYVGTFDSRRGRVVVFGGRYGPGNSTWEFDGREWTEGTEAPRGLTEREGHGMAYDPDRRVTVVFGGMDGMVCNDTWEYDGTWRQGPDPAEDLWRRRDPGLAFDASRHVVVLFGGDDSGRTWEYSAGHWRRSEVAPDALKGREDCPLAYDPDRRRVVLFGGGQDYSSAAHGDTWEYDGRNWVPGSPTPAELGARYCTAMVYDSAAKAIVLFGGKRESGMTLGDTWEYEASGWTHIVTDAAPTARGQHAMAYHSTRGVVVLFGGRANADYREPPRGDTWAFADGAWTPLPVSVPEEMGPRARHRIVYDESRRCLVLFGGVDKDAEDRNDTWELRDAGKTLR